MSYQPKPTTGRQAEIHIGDHRGLVRVVRFDVDRDERVERIVIPSEFGDNAVQVVPFREDNQPNPATGAGKMILDAATKLRDMASDQPTGEWTAESVREIGGQYSITQQRDQAIADEHNAALADEREKHKTLAHAFESERELRKRYEDQLAAEREARKQSVKNLENAAIIISDFREQLAVEKERVKHLFNLYLWTDQEFKKLCKCQTENKKS